MAVQYEDMVPWVLFYGMKARSKDSDAWRKSNGFDAAVRERTVRENYYRALEGKLTKEDKAWHKVLACRGQEG